MTLDEIMIAYYRDTRKNKRRSHDSIAFEVNEESNLCSLLEDVNNHTFVSSVYAFIVSRPVTREIIAGDMRMRIVQHYINTRVQPLVEARLIPTTFNNRVGMGGTAAVNNLISDIYEVSEGFTNPNCWIIKVDMQGYFPNANQDIAFKQLEQLVMEDYKGEDIDDLLYLIRVNIFSYPRENCKRLTPLPEWSAINPEKSIFTKDDGISAQAGQLIWQLAMTYYINDICIWLMKVCGLKITVYMDDIAIVTDNKESTLALMPELRRRLAELGVTLHPKKFYCQHYTKGVEFIGKHIKMGRVYTNNRCRRNALHRIDYFNRVVRVSKIDSFVASVNSYLGQFKTVCGYNIVQEILKRIDTRWWKYVEYDRNRICIRPREEYSLKNRLTDKFKLKNYDKKKRRNGKNDRAAQGAGVPVGTANIGAEELPYQ